MTHAILPGFPRSGERVRPIASPIGAGGAWSGHREGLVVRFRANDGSSWIGNFQPGGIGWTGIIEHPDRRHLLVVAQGAGYLVDPIPGSVSETIPDPIHHALALPSLDAVGLSDGCNLEAIGKGGRLWLSPRISWDEMRSLAFDGDFIVGEASTPTLNGNAWVPFHVNARTGACTDGIYEAQIRRATRL